MAESRSLFWSFALLWPTIVWAQPGLIGWFESDCPDGWGPYDSVEGRSIVGAGSQYSVSQTGGSASIRLSETQIPNHDHSLFTSSASGTVLTTYGTACGSKTDAGDSNYRITQCSGSPSYGKSGYQYSGAQSSIDLRDPYLALNGCILLVDITNQTVGYHSSMISNLQSADISQMSRLQDLETQSNANGQLISQNADVISDHSTNLEQNDASLLLHTSRLEVLESGSSDHSTTLEQNNALLASHSTSISSLETSDISQNSGIEALESSVDTNADSIAALSSNLESLEESVNEDHTTLTNLQSDVTDNSLSIIGLEASVGVLNGHDFSTLSTSVAVLDVKVQSIESTSQQFSSALETVEEMEETVTAFQNDLTTLENSIVLLNGQFDQLQSQYMSLDNSMNSLQSSNSALTTSMQGLETRVSQIEHIQSTDSSTSTTPPLNAGTEITTDNETTILTSMANDIVTIISIAINVILGFVLYIVRRDVDTMRQSFLQARLYNGGGELPRRKPDKMLELGLYRNDRE